MKNIIHHALLVSSKSTLRLTEVRQKCMEIMQNNISSNLASTLVSPMMLGLINQFQTFIILPDGSKEGYDISDEADLGRQKIVSFLNELDNSNSDNSVRYVEVAYAKDDGQAAILNNN